MRKIVKVILSIEVIIFMVMVTFLGLYTQGALADSIGSKKAFQQVSSQVSCRAQTHTARLVANEYF